MGAVIRPAAFNPFADTIDDAQALGAVGFHVSPIRAGAKTPLRAGWQNEATMAPTSWPDDANVGIFTGRFGEGRALLVVDVDCKNGKDGNVALAELEAEHGALPETREHATANGGRHLIFAVDRPVASSAGKLGVGLDVRSAGAYVVGPGSVVDGREYSVLRDRPVADAPEWLVERCGAPRVRERKAAPRSGVDRERALARARLYLRDDAPLAVEGEGGDATTYKVACRLKDFGLEADDTHSVMLDGWNDRCSPSWAPVDLRAKVDHAYAYGLEPPGVAAVEADFQPVADATSAPAAPAPAAPAIAPKVRKLSFVTLAEIEPDMDRRALVEGWLGLGDFSMVYGGSGEGKSFLAVDLAVHVAAGMAWHGQAVERGAVVYIAAESPGSSSVGF